MKKPCDWADSADARRERVVLSGQRSIAKGHDPDLQAHLDDLERFRGLLDQSRDAILLARVPSGRLVDANETACRQLDYARENILTLTVGDLVAPSSSDWMTALFSDERAMQGAAESITTRLRRRDGDDFPVEITVRVVAFGGTLYAVIVARDITERVQAEDTLHYHADFEQLVINISTDFINLAPAEIDSGINAALRAIGKFAGVDRSYVFLFSADGTRMDRVYDWAAGGIEPLTDDVRGAPTAIWPWFTEQLRRFEVIYVPRLTDLPPEAAAERAILESRGTQSSINVPMVSGGSLLGFVGCSSLHQEKVWDAASIALLKIVGRIFVNALERKRAEEALRISEQRLEQDAEIFGALARVGQELIAALDTSAILQRVCDLTTEVMPCDASYTFLRSSATGGFAPVASSGTAPEEREVLRILSMPPTMLTSLLARLERGEAVHMNMAEAVQIPTTQVGVRYGLTNTLDVGLWRGGEVVGFQVAAYRDRQDIFTDQQERIAKGIAHLASLALENARLIEELERANRIKADFLATMSHELRTPLNVITGYNDLVLEGAFGSLTPEQSESLRLVAKSVRELTDLIEATLDVSRMDTGRLPVEPREVLLVPLMHEVDSETRTLQEKSSVRFVWKIPSGLPPVHTDPAKLKVVLKNLIGNAVKFTDQGQVTVSAAERNDGVEFSVADTGVGIAPESLANIFEPFRQADSTITQSRGGVGLGLYIVRRLLELLGGSITVESTVGRGTVFHVWIPRVATSTPKSLVDRLVT